MIRWIINALIILGSLLMIINIVGFVKYAVFVKGRQKLDRGRGILYVPIVLLVLFFIGYVTVGIFGSPDIIMAGILFGGSIFVFIILLLINRITRMVIESEQLESKLIAAEEGNRMKNAFLANISHEMRTPLNVILGIDELAQKRNDIPDETRTQLVKIEKNGKLLLALINDVLDIQNTDAESQQVKNVCFSIRDVISQLEAMTGTMCEVKGLRFISSVDENIKNVLIGDDVILKQILMSLLDNAVKYTSEPGTVTLKLENESSADEKCVIRFIVQDTGIGISEEFLPKVFDLFSKEDASFTDQFGGSGMGLAVTKQKVEQLNGKISVESKSGEGSAFTVVIPFGIADNEALPDTDKSTAETADMPEEGASLEGCRVLIVEDVDDNAEIVADLLELEGCESERACNGAEAVEMFSGSEAGYYDVILMDLRMPVMDGLEATRKIRELNRNDAKTIPIIALTANAFEEDIKNTRNAGMNAHLAKPADSDLLYSTIRSFIKLKQ